jgi:hypothetical protein
MAAMGMVPVDMAYLTARDGRPAAYCEERVRGVRGVRRGDRVPVRVAGAGPA